MAKTGKASVPHKEQKDIGPRMEIPTTVAQSITEAIIEYKDYTCSYNEDFKIPNWLAYELTSEELHGPYSRKDKQFRRDESINLAQADGYDYSGSGWTRGHMAPAADFSFDDDSMWDTFYYTNCCPQASQLNFPLWEKLEERVRGWATQFGKVWIVTGPVIIDNKYGTIGEHKVVVPDAFFKVVLCQHKGEYHSIAFIMENTGDSPKYYNCMVRVNDVEKITGFDFFSLLDDSIEESVESEMNYNLWNIHHE